VLLLHFADAKRDLSGTVAKLAKFYDVELSEAEHATVVEKCSFQHMKAHSDMFSYALPLNTAFNARGGRIMTKNTMIRKGQNGDGKVTFNAEQKALWENAEREQFSDEKLRNWAQHGGEF
jgi:hypothetical protein